jgi:hypothetical protein
VNAVAIAGTESRVLSILLAAARVLLVSSRTPDIALHIFEHSHEAIYRRGYLTGGLCQLVAANGPRFDCSGSAPDFTEFLTYPIEIVIHRVCRFCSLESTSVLRSTEKGTVPFQPDRQK